MSSNTSFTSRGGVTTEVHRGNKVAAKFVDFPPNREVLVITFPAVKGTQSLDSEGFGEGFLAKNSIPAVHVTTASNDWFQNDEYDALMSTIEPISRQFTRVVTYGSSMGGYGAAISSGKLGAHAIVAFSPQVSIDRRRVPLETRWAREAAVIVFSHDDMETMVNPDSHLYILYDPVAGNDVLHVKEMCRFFSRSTLIPVPFSGHVVGRYLKAAGLLSKLKHLLVGNFNPNEFRQQQRQKRSHIPEYWAGMTHACIVRGKLSLSEYAAGKAVEVDPLSLSAKEAVAAMYLATGRLKMARAGYEELLLIRNTGRIRRGLRQSVRAIEMVEKEIHLAATRLVREFDLITRYRGRLDMPARDVDREAARDALEPLTAALGRRDYDSINTTAINWMPVIVAIRAKRGPDKLDYYLEELGRHTDVAA